jgi:hypothetical protein
LAQTEDAIAGDPSGGRGQHRGSGERDDRCSPLELKVHFEPAQQDAREQVGKNDADCTRQKPQHTELHADSAHDTHARGAQRFEHDRLSHAAEACAGNARGQNREAGENRKPGK